jgi:hypothetical protein
MANENEKLKIAGLACLIVGIPKIQSWSEGTAQAEILSEAYEPLLEAELSLYKWRFATEYFNLKPNLLAEEPLSRYNCAYQLPTNPGVVSVDTVLIDSIPIAYERRGQEIHTRDTALQDVILQYRYRADETKWYPYFRMLMVYRLATLAAFSVARNTTVADSMKELANEQFKMAKTEDSQSQTSKRLDLSKQRRARSGSVNKFWRDR